MDSLAPLLALAGTYGPGAGIALLALAVLWRLLDRWRPA